MHFDDSFFKGEYREDFYVPPMMKRAWAGEMEILMMLDSLCKVYGLTYYAAYGTLLGAVRHKGFVPWDDDIDVWMKREDVMKLMSIPKEVYDGLGLEFITPYVEPSYNNLVFTLVNGRSMDLSQERLLKYHGCPFNLRVDVFTLDYLPRDRELEDKQDRLASVAYTLGDEWDKDNMSEEERKRLMAELMDGINYGFDESMPMGQQLICLCDAIMGMYGEEDADFISNIPNRADWSYDHERFRKEWFGKPVYLDFENIKIPVPAEYEKVLDNHFGDWRTPAHWAAHGYPFYKNQMEILHRGFTDNGFDIPDIFKE
ncbi:MAG: LicD family protein [Lachnospiraceae bacterium]|nr:LicD family protein [Lachnospiraceae bacterium]